MFMTALRQGDKDAHFGFRQKMPGSMPRGSAKGGNKFVESLRYSNQQDKEEKLSIIIEGLELFEKIMGYPSRSFIPPNYFWSVDFDRSVAAQNVRFYQGRRKMKEPLFDGSFQLNNHKLGEENDFGQKYLIRNATFEPAMLKNKEDSVNRCLKDIATAFRMNKPAVICSHRLNYVGFLDEQNRDKNLNLLDKLLHQIVKRWPEVEFLNSVELGKAMGSENGRTVQKYL